MTKAALLSLLCVAPLVALEAAAAILVPVSQDRRVTATAEFWLPVAQTDSESFSATDFGPFSEMAGAMLDQDGDSISASASQTSSFGDSGIQASGSAAAMDPNAAIFLGDGTAQANSTFVLTFDLLSAVDYFFSADLTASASGPGASSRLRLTGPGGILFDELIFTPDEFFGFGQFSGTLLPGQYTLEAFANATFPAGSGASTRSASYSVDLSFTPVPEPGTGLLVSLGLLGPAAARTSRRRTI
jgi:hypothetical protein